jgi:tetratricopeptide (TPR) repeat protein
LLLAIPLPWVLLASAPASASLVDRLAAQVHAAIDTLLANADPYQRTSALGYFATQCTVIPRYLALVFLPWGFNVDPDVPFAAGVSPAVLAGFVFLAGLAVAGFSAARRWPLIGFAVLWVFVALSVESSFLPISDPMMEHRMYLAMLGIVLAVSAIFVGLFARFPRPAAVVAVTAVAVLISLTIARNEVWRSSLSLWQDALEKSPNKARVHVNVGASLHQLDRLDDAIRHYCRALELDPHNREAEYNLEAAVEARGFGAEAAVGGEGAAGGEGLVLMVEDPREACKDH